MLGMDNRVSFDLDQGGDIDQPGDLNHRERGADLVEELAVNLTGFLPFLNIRDKQPGANHVGCLAAQGLDRGDDDLQARRVCPFIVGA